MLNFLLNLLKCHGEGGEWVLGDRDHFAVFIGSLGKALLFLVVKPHEVGNFEDL